VGRERIGRSRCRLYSALAVMLVCGCQSLSGGSSPRTSLPPGFPAECTATFGVTQMNRLLAVLGSGTPDAVRALIVAPAPHQDGLELTPTMADFLAKGSQPHTTSDLQVHDRADELRQDQPHHEQDEQRRAEARRKVHAHRPLGDRDPVRLRERDQGEQEQSEGRVGDREGDEEAAAREQELSLIHI